MRWRAALIATLIILAAGDVALALSGYGLLIFEKFDPARPDGSIGIQCRYWTGKTIADAYMFPDAGDDCPTLIRVPTR